MNLNDFEVSDFTAQMRFLARDFDDEELTPEEAVRIRNEAREVIIDVLLKMARKDERSSTRYVFDDLISAWREIKH